jgi:hypothetical protein
MSDAIEYFIELRPFLIILLLVITLRFLRD